MISNKIVKMEVYANGLDEFNTGHSVIKVKVMAQLAKFSPFTTIQTVKSYILFPTCML